MAIWRKYFLDKDFKMNIIHLLLSIGALFILRALQEISTVIQLYRKFLFYPSPPALSPVCGGEGKGEGG